MSAPHLSNGPKAAVFTNGYGYGAPTPCYPPPEASYEEITQNPQFFLEKLRRFHSALGTKFKVPTLGGKSLDIHRLFIEVTSRGGIEKIVRDRRWKEIMVVFKFGPTITSASFVLRKYYLSLLYHFEQVYYFRKKGPVSAVPDAATRLPNGSRSMHAAAENQFSASSIGEAGGLVTGMIDKKFEHGYLVTVDLGSEKLNGVLYHLPAGSNTSPAPSHGSHSMFELSLRDPSPPEIDRSGYDVFFTEHYVRLKPLYHGQEHVISRRIEVLWSTLTEDEKKVYQEKGSRDKER